MEGRRRVIIENVKPEINNGRFPVKRVVNDSITVEADIYCDGHDSIRAELLYRHTGQNDWSITEMKHMVNDRWHGTFQVKTEGEHYYTIRGWVDRSKTWYSDILKKIDAAVEIKGDIAMGLQLIENIRFTYGSLKPEDQRYLDMVTGLLLSGKSETEKIKIIEDRSLYETLLRYPLRLYVTDYIHQLKVICERPKAAFSAWYEFFPRSLNSGSKGHGTLKDCISHLKYVAEMGFDVIYLPPIHPIGETGRKSKNNTLELKSGDPGSPWAIGSREGGHKSIHKQLGTPDDFRELVKKAKDYGIEVALDIAFQCSPDHPYIKEHPQWFRHRPDGTIRYAENPPKKYEDIFPFDFETEDWENMWEEFKSIFVFWIEQGVKIFRVDNPHTKPLRFWGWLIEEIHKQYPEVIFLAEAFTRPKVMYQLAKRGFTQSYTYFTWRNTKWELTKYFEELVQSEVGEFLRPNLWPNTPDILPEFLQISGRSGFLIRIILAATLSSSYGIYGPAFELMENQPKESGSEEYLDSEKYEIKNWNINNKNSLKTILKMINRIRFENPALHNNSSLRFHETEDENLIAYSKYSYDLSNIVLVVVNLDPHHTHSGWVHISGSDFEIKDHEIYQVHDLLGGAHYLWNGQVNYIELNPEIMPAHIFRVRRKVRTEQDFDYFM